jgi:hypothetical protein
MLDLARGGDADVIFGVAIEIDKKTACAGTTTPSPFAVSPFAVSHPSGTAKFAALEEPPPGAEGEDGAGNAIQHGDGSFNE